MDLKVFLQPTGRMYKGEAAQHPSDSELPFVSAELFAVLHTDKTMDPDEATAAIAALKLNPPAVVADSGESNEESK